MKPKKIVPIVTFLLLAFAVACRLKEDGKEVDTNPNEPLKQQENAPISLNLGAASKFVVLAGSEITNTLSSSITGNVGVAPGNSMKGFPPGIVYGEKFVKGSDTLAAGAQKDLAAAYKTGKGLSSSGIIVLKENLGGLTLIPGLYKAESNLDVSGGDLTFDAKGDSTSMFVLQVPGALTVAATSKVSLTGGAQAKNIFWLIGTHVRLDSNAVVKGNILAEESIFLGKNTNLQGRALSKTGKVELKGSTVVRP